VVISIIGLLVALLLPALQSARQTANLIDCANRMRQSTLCILMYIDENREVFPTQYGPGLAPNTAPYSGVMEGGMEYRGVIAKYSDMWDAMLNYNDWYSGNLNKNPMLCKASDGLATEPGPNYWSADSVKLWSDFTVLYGAYPVFFSTFQINPYFGTADCYKYSPTAGYYGYNTRKGMPKTPSLTFALADGYREARPNYWYVADGIGMFRFRHFQAKSRVAGTPQGNEGIMNMSYLDGHVKGWKYEVNGPIWPTGGDGLWTVQQGFRWWNGEVYN
jgi:prepilin-type processing-associated H-X9-DG protein